MHVLFWMLVALTCVLWEVRAVSAEQRSRSVAIGLGVRGSGLSLWHVEGAALLGIELTGLKWSWDKGRDVDNKGAVTLQYIFSRGKLDRFGYFSAYHARRTSYQEIHFKSNRTGVELGCGVIAKPFKKIHLLLRQGVSLGKSLDSFGDGFVSYEYPYDSLIWTEEVWYFRLRTNLWLLMYF